jgi:hypothetical protein
MWNRPRNSRTKECLSNARQEFRSKRYRIQPPPKTASPE